MQITTLFWQFWCLYRRRKYCYEYRYQAIMYTM